MRKLHPRRRSEESIQASIRRKMLGSGFTLVEKTHGNQYQPGWPDLMCFHIEGGRVVWVEVKRPGGRLTPRQVTRFTFWEDAGVPIWVLDSEDLSPLTRPPNWRAWLPRRRAT